RAALAPSSLRARICVDKRRADGYCHTCGDSALGRPTARENRQRPALYPASIASPISALTGLRVPHSRPPRTRQDDPTGTLPGTDLREPLHPHGWPDPEPVRLSVSDVCGRSETWPEWFRHDTHPAARLHPQAT